MLVRLSHTLLLSSHGIASEQRLASQDGKSESKPRKSGNAARRNYQNGGKGKPHTFPRAESGEPIPGKRNGEHHDADHAAECRLEEFSPREPLCDQ